MFSGKKIAVLFQAALPPMRNGIIKPMKPGGYSDSGADIAYCLKKTNICVVTPKEDPDIQNDFDWVFPDTTEGIKQAIIKGANVIWLNTVLYEGHAIEKLMDSGREIVGQIPKYADMFDDKWVTNNLLKSKKIPLPRTIFIERDFVNDMEIDLPFPVVIKPIRGRGSQGVQVVENVEELQKQLRALFESKQYGDSAYIEEFLPGQEITITVMPPGKYIINQELVTKYDYWSLPAVKRFNHEKGVAPYNGVLAVVNNSCVLSDEELETTSIKSVEKQCEYAAKLVHAKAHIRIDCRQNRNDEYLLFDLNMKPNNTGPSRPHRMDQDSLTAIAAKKIGWNYSDLLTNLLLQSWTNPV